MTQVARAVLALAAAMGSTALLAQDGPDQGRGEKVDGYAEFRLGGCIVADAQRVCPAPGLKFKGEGLAKDFASIPLGYELKAKGTRRPDGALRAVEIEAKPNGSALFEGDIRTATDQAEEQARKIGRFVQDEGGKLTNVGLLHEDGPYVERVRTIVDSLAPPYLHPEEVRIYVIENKEWNAFAMGNYSIYVFTGLLNDLDDDEVAIVLGHELVHATHEHTRKELKRTMWVQLAALGVLGASSSIDGDKKRAAVQLVTGLAATAYSSGYSRGMEDQADRVGLRYAYEAGYDVTKGPRLWNRFAKKYGEVNKVVGFFFSDHSQSAARAAKLEKELAYNYPEGPKPEGPARRARGEWPPARTFTVAATPAGIPAGARALRTTPPLPVSNDAAAPASDTERTEIEVGMTANEVRRLLGDPEAEMVFGLKTRWTYPALTIVFVNGKVGDVKF